MDVLAVAVGRGAVDVCSLVNRPRYSRDDGSREAPETARICPCHKVLDV